MLSVDSLPVAEEEVVDSSSNRLGDIYTFVAEGCYPQAMNPIRKKNLKRYAQKFTIDDGRLYYVGPKKEEKREVVIEAERKRQIFLECHFNDIGHHLGQKKTVHRIQSKYYWLGIVKDVVDWIKVCETCQHAERNKNLARTVRPIKVDGPWDILAVEIIGPFPGTSHRGNTHIVIITDYYSKWVEAFPVQKKDGLCVARCISSSTCRFGPAKTIFCSQSADFCEEVTKHLCDRWNIAQRVLSVDQPQRNALYDRSSNLLRDAIKQMVVEKQFDPLSCYQDQEDETLNEEDTNAFLSSLQEQQNNIKQMVVTNMNVAYRQEKKNAKRKARNMPSITLTVTDPLFSTEETPSAKKLKESLYLSFPVETVLTTVQNVPEAKKNGLEYPLTDSDVH
ncbi:gypsy retrotransposon integrase-like protein 1 isoform X2 [Onychostoma macrolepis]|uniref:gypsy retrotransposon integrase-like protein 1 isoform X2 n=1 Tax=Onychostoma macrolepis TaxID=369639 RepID=UPI00272B8473|nr:gypsy retrotransposon integrase-like protein 1 isoform X2 [Onychostoma macrolepis]